MDKSEILALRRAVLENFFRGIRADKLP